jgi:glycerate-2-kinase
MKSYDSSKQIIRNILDESLLVVDPYKAVNRHVEYVLSLYNKLKLNKLFVVGFCKAPNRKEKRKWPLDYSWQS